MIRFIISPRYQALNDWLHRLPTIFEKEGTVVYDSRNLIKVFTLADGTQVNVKRYHAPRGINLLVYSLGIRKAKGLRAYQYPGRLLAAGISTPEAIAYIEERHAGLLGYSYFVSTQCPYPHRMYEVGNARQGEYEQLAVDFASFTAHIHNQGVMHLDYSPGNILFTRMDDGHYAFSLVDINRMHFGAVSHRRGLANFKRIWGPKDFFVRMIREYARLRQINEEEALSYALLARRRFWTRYQRKHEMDFKLEL